MAAANTPALAAIAPATPRSPAAQKPPQQPEAEGKPTFAQVLKSRSQAPEAPRQAASKAPTKTEGARDTADNTIEATAQANSTPLVDPALLIATAGLTPVTATANQTVTSPFDGEHVALVTDVSTQRDASLFASATAAFAAQAASLAGKTNTNNATDNTPKKQTELVSADTLSGEADGRPLPGQSDTEPRVRSEALRVSAESSADKPASALQTEKSASFATELVNASQPRDANTSTQATHGVLPGPQLGRNSEALPQHEVSTPVATRGWAEEVGQKVSWIASRDNGRAEIVLTPPSMGRVEISISMNGDQASATFITASPAAREALQDAMPRLREVLAQSGIQLGQANVNEGSSQQQAHSDNPGRRSSTGRFSDPVDTSLAPVGSTSGSWTGRGSGAIDIFA